MQAQKYNVRTVTVQRRFPLGQIDHQIDKNVPEMSDFFICGEQSAPTCCLRCKSLSPNCV